MMGEACSTVVGVLTAWPVYIKLAFSAALL
jgi:hypothetical protein